MIFAGAEAARNTSDVTWKKTRVKGERKTAWPKGKKVKGQQGALTGRSPLVRMERAAENQLWPFFISGGWQQVGILTKREALSAFFR
jgi:hypothetical protein